MNRAEYAALAERRACEDGICWAEPLIEACDHWKAETERLRDLLTGAHRQVRQVLHEANAVPVAELRMERAKVRRLQAENKRLRAALAHERAENHYLVTGEESSKGRVAFDEVEHG